MNSKTPIDFSILDSLRGIAAVYVVVNHARGSLLIGGSTLAQQVPFEQWPLTQQIYYTILQLTSIGHEFVIFFFVLSGFSIAYSLRKKAVPLQFYKRRLVRLYPPFILALCWAAIVFLAMQTFSPLLLDPDDKSVFDSIKSTVLNLLYIPTGSLINQFWSLTHEVIFYLLIPLFYLFGIKAYYVLSIAGYLAGWFINGANAPVTPVWMIYILEYNFFFFVGIFFFRNFEWFRTRLVLPRAIFFLLSSIIIVAIVGLKLKFGYAFKPGLLLAAGLSIIAVVNFLHYSINTKILRFLGRMSYTMYITHFASLHLFAAIVYLVSGIDPMKSTNPYLWILGVFFAVLVSYPLYLLAEVPTRRVLEKIRGNQKPGLTT